MDQTHIHLALNHIPVLGTFFGICVLVYGLLGKSGPVERTGLITLVIAAVMTIPVFLTGEGAEEIVENLPDVSEFYIEEHEDLAKIGLWLMIATGGCSLIAWLWSLRNVTRYKALSIVVLILAITTFGLMAQVANHGGKIRHSEIRTGTTWKDGVLRNGNVGNHGDEHNENHHD